MAGIPKIQLEINFFPFETALVRYSYPSVLQLSLLAQFFNGLIPIVNYYWIIFVNLSHCKFEFISKKLISWLI